MSVTAIHSHITLPSSEDEQVLLWRAERLRAAGYSTEDACRLAASRHVDLHRALQLVSKGCAPATALRILL